MKIILTQNPNIPSVSWFLKDEFVKNILSNTQILDLCHVKSIKPAFDFSNEYVWDNENECPVAIFKYSFFENLMKKFKKNKKQENLNDFQILNIKIEIFNRTKQFKMFLNRNIVPLFKDFLKMSQKLNLDGNFKIFFNQNIEKYIYYTFEKLEKSVYLALVADRLLFIQDKILYLNEFYLIVKNSEKILIQTQKIGNIDEIF